jgi:hypothetical protein
MAAGTLGEKIPTRVNKSGGKNKEERPGSHGSMKTKFEISKSETIFKISKIGKFPNAPFRIYVIGFYGFGFVSDFEFTEL